MIRQSLTCTAVASLLFAAGCGGSGNSAEEGVSGEVIVMAAASLTETFDVLAEDFEQEYSGTEVTVLYDGSSSLAAQINNKAPADVFASADETNMDVVVDAGGVTDEPEIFTHNSLVIAVPKGNPDNIDGLDALADVSVALCAQEVPCGSASVAALEAADVTLEPETYEKDVKTTLAKVTLGEVDAALVYRTDAQADSDVTAIEFPEAAEAINDYPIAVLREAPNPRGAQEFTAYVQSEYGQETLQSHGFGEQ